MRALAAVAILFAAPAALANGTHLPDVVDVLLTQGDETSVTLETNFGLLQSNDGGPFHWICTETLTPFPGLVPIHATNADGVILGSVRLTGFGVDPRVTLYRSTDDGCTWGPVSGLDDVSVSAIAFDPADPSRAIATAATGAALNAIWVSGDAGASWTKTPVEGDFYVYGVLFAEAGPQVVWATASNPSEDFANVYWSSNGGASFALRPFEERPSGMALGSLSILATSPTDPQTAWMRTYGVPNRLWITTNGGIAFTEVFQTNSLLDADVLPDGRTWVATATSGHFLALDGRTFSAMGSSPNPRGFAHDGRGLFSATDPYFDPYALTLSSSGNPASAVGLFHFDQIAGPKPCPAGSTVKTVCEPLYHALQVRLGLVLGRVPEPQEHLAEDRSVGGGGGCACSTAPSSRASIAGALLVAALTALLRHTTFRRTPWPTAEFRSRKS